MEEQLITFETAKLAKEKGFPKLEVNGYPKIATGYTKEGIETIVMDRSYYYQAPTQSLLQKWLREKHNIEIQIFTMGVFMDKSTQPHSDFELSNGFNKYHFGGNFDKTTSSLGYKTYEEALEKGLQESLKRIQYGK